FHGARRTRYGARGAAASAAEPRAPPLGAAVGEPAGSLRAPGLRAAPAAARRARRPRAPRHAALRPRRRCANHRGARGRRPHRGAQELLAHLARAGRLECGSAGEVRHRRRGAERNMSLRQFLVVLRARSAIWAAIMVATVAAAGALSVVLPKRYTATAEVLLDVKSPDPVYGTLLHAMVMPGYMATQRDVVASDRVAQRAVELLGLDKDAGERAQWLEATGGKGSFDAWLAAKLQSQLTAKPLPESNVIQISYRAGDAAFAAAAANAFARAYIDVSIELRVEPAKEYARWFGTQDHRQREQLEKAQARLAEHQQKYGLLASDERLDAETTRLNDLSAQLTVAQSQSAEARGKARSSAALTEVLQSPLIHALRGDIVRQEAKLREASGNLGANHPQYQQMETELAAAIAEQKKKVLAIRQARDQHAALQRDLDMAQKAYETVAQRYGQSRLESQFTQSNISVLAFATAPLAPSFPNARMNLLLAIFLGAFAGVAAAFVVEMLDRRLRSADDVAEMLQLPVLGGIPRATKQALPALR